MPPRYSYWTIIAGGLPTAFRAAEREELEPTFQRLREKHPDAEMKWFARGKLWESPEASRAPRDDDRRDEAPRRREWRPGGEHRDPRQPFKDAKKARNQRWREEKFEHRQRGADRAPSEPDGRGDRERAPREKPHGDKLQPRRRWEGGGERTPGASTRPPFSREGQPRPHGDKFARDTRERKPFGERERKSFDRPRGAGGGERPEWKRDGAPKRPPFGREGGKSFDSRERKPYGDRARQPYGAGERKPFESRERKPYGDRDRKPFETRDRKPFESRERKPSGDRDRKPFEARDRKPFESRERRPSGDRDRKPFEARDRKPFESRDRKPFGARERKPGDRDRAPAGARPEWKRDGAREGTPREKPHGDKLRAGFDKRGDRPRPDRPRDDRDQAPNRAPREGGERTFASKRRENWNNEWVPREKPHGDKLPDRGAPTRSFERRGGFERGQGGTDEPAAPPRPRGPNREPRPSENPSPGPPPRPSEPAVPPPGPPERGRLNKNRRRS